MKIYTKSGDDGTTGVLGPGRLTKDSPRIDAYGTVDELNATLGVARSQGLPKELDALLGRVQNDLFVVGSSLADPNPEGRFHRALGPERIHLLESAIDDFEASLPALSRFILPGGGRSASHLHLARTVCRRAERAIVHLGRIPGETIAPEIKAYINRLGDLLFVLARLANQRDGISDVPWDGL